MSIPFIKINNVNVRKLNIPDINVFHYDLKTPLAPGHPTAIDYIGRPIVNIPGCVETHPDDRNAQNLPDDDPQKVVTICDAEMPSYDAMDYVPEQLIITTETPPPPVQPPPDPPGAPEVPDTSDTGVETECPAPNQPRVGDLTTSGDEKVVGHELQGTVCVVLYEPTTVVDKYLPSANVVTTTATIAAVATASALFAKPLADLILRALKPLIKKATGVVQKKLGRHRTLSRLEIQSNKYREKKGLPPVKPPKKNKKLKG